MVNNNIFKSILLVAIFFIPTITTNSSAADYIDHRTQQTTNYSSAHYFSNLDHTDITALLKYGNFIEKQLLLKYLISERYNFKMLDILISYYIDNERNDLVKYWLSWGKQNNIKIKPWQRLHLAIIEKDNNLIKHILKTDNKHLHQSIIDNALITLYQDSTSLIDGQKHLFYDNNNLDNAALQLHISALDFSLSNNTLMTVSSENFDKLYIHSVGISGEIKYDSHTISIQGKNNIFDTDNNEYLPIEYIDNEIDIYIKTSKRFNNNNTFSFGIGNNYRSTDSITYATLLFGYQYNDYFHGSFMFDYNTISNTTAALRTLGYKNKASLALNFKPSINFLLNFTIDTHEYKTRNNDYIGDGYGVMASFSHILSTEPFYWDVSIRSSVEKNKLANTIPAYITTTQLDNANDIVDEDNGFIGLGTTFRYGFINNRHYLTNNLSLNGYTGFTLPDKSLSYGIDVDYGYAITPLKLLGFKVVYSNAYNKIEDNDYAKLMFYYKQHY